MKKLNVNLILFVVTLCALLSFSPIKANADTVIYLQYQAITGYSYTGVDGKSYSQGAIGPYLATLNGDGYNNMVVEVMCYDMNIDVSLYGSYTGTVTSITTPVTPDELNFMEATYLTNLLMDEGGRNADVNEYRGPISLAVWQIMNADTLNPLSSFPADAAAQPFIADAIAAVGNGTDGAWTIADANQYLTWGPLSSNPAQRFGIINTPEPGSLILLGSGLLGISGFAYRRRRHA
jgi:hypothetical protein